jgi:uncharacterized repeat protein (TIGR02543 family)
MPQTPVFSKYDLVFTATGKTAVEVLGITAFADTGYAVELETGTWTATVTAYTSFTLNEGTAFYKAAEGSGEVTVTEKQPATVEISISPITLNAAGALKGIFTYTVSFPAAVTMASLVLKQGETEILNLENTALSSETAVSQELPAGYYDLHIILEKGALTAGDYTGVYIYPGLESKAEFVFTDADFAEHVYLTGTASITKDPADILALENITVRAYGSSSGTEPINGISAAITGNDTWLLGLPASYAGQDLYLALWAPASDGYEYSAPKEAAGTIAEAGKTGIALSITVVVKGTQEAADFTTAHSAVLLKTVETVAIADESGVDAALTAYNALSPAAQALVSDEKDLLDTLKTKITELKVYTVTFNKNDSDTEASPADKTVAAPETTVGTLPSEPTRSGYTFASWNTAADGSGTDFTAATTVMASITVYAQWTVISTDDLPLTLYFDDKGNAAFTVDTAITLSKGLTQSRTITLSDTWTSQAWYVDANITAKGTETSFTLNAADYTVGTHKVTVQVRNGSVYWSKTIAFTVTN